jgi:endonuclease YncB( thermonuclease family)
MATRFHPTYPIIRGNFVITGYEPDGDSVRFIADDPTLYNNLQRHYRIKLSKDGSVQLRLEGVDATELHYGTAAQPFGAEARDTLLSWTGFRNVAYADTSSTKVASSTPESIPGGILSLAAEANGRPVSYMLLDADLETGDTVRVDEAVLRKTLNYRLLEAGMAYYTVYTSMPAAHRDFFRATASSARSSRKGIWAVDRTSEFVLDDQESIGPDGQCILPKLFRRCTDYLKAVGQGFVRNLSDWMFPFQPARRVMKTNVLSFSTLRILRVLSKLISPISLVNAIALSFCKATFSTWFSSKNRKEPKSRGSELADTDKKTKICLHGDLKNPPLSNLEFQLEKPWENFLLSKVLKMCGKSDEGISLHLVVFVSLKRSVLLVCPCKARLCR